MLGPPDRPLPSARLRRRSLQPTSRSLGAVDGSAPGPAPSAGHMGGLRERDAAELPRATRDELEIALRHEWSEREELVRQRAELQKTLATQAQQLEEAQAAVVRLETQLVAENDDQLRLEEDVEAKDAVIGRLRATIKDVEKAKRDADRRYVEQEKSFEEERRSQELTERHLRATLAAVMAKLEQAEARAPAEIQTPAAVTAVTGEDPALLLRLRREAQQDKSTLADARAEIDQYAAENAHLHAQAKSLVTELHQLKSDFAELREQLDSYEVLLRERTLDGTMRLGGAVAKSSQDLFVNGEDGNGSDRMASNQGLIDDNQALRDSNKALSLYCSKILDRIISQPGYEHILSKDYGDKPGTVRKNSRIRGSAVKTPTPASCMLPSTEMATTAQASSATPLVRHSSKRRSILNPFGFGLGSNPQADGPGEEAEASEPPKALTRGLSLNWRAVTGLGRTATSRDSADSTVSASLSAQGEVPKQTNSTTASPPVITGGRVPEEEDEDDRQERERLAATMKLMGIRTEMPTERFDTVSDGADHDGAVNASKRVVRPATPLTRFSSFLGRDAVGVSSPLSPEAEALDHRLPVTEETVKAALQSFDQREREQASRISKKSGPSSLTSPSPDLIMAIAPRRRASARAKSDSASPEGSDRAVSTRKDEHASSGSIDTLWSLGESPKPEGHI